MNNTTAFNVTITNITSTAETFCKIETDAVVIIYTVFMSLFLLLSLCGNCLVIVAVGKSPALKKRVSSLFIVSLACSDFYFAISLIPIKISFALYGKMFCHALSTCYWYLMSDVLANVASILNLLVIAIDRFIAIKFPYVYTNKVTSKRARLVIVGVWSIALSCSISGIFEWDTNPEKIFTIFISVRKICANSNYIMYVVIYFAIYLSSLVLMSCIYAVILHVALMHIKKIEKRKSGFVNNHTTSITNNNLSTTNEENKSLKNNRPNMVQKYKREFKTTKSLAIVYGAFVVCWLPSCVISIITMFNKNYFYDMKKNNTPLFLFIFYTFIEILPPVNAVVNPFIYSFSNKQFRGAFKKVLYRLCGKYVNDANLYSSTVGYSSPRLTTTEFVHKLTSIQNRRSSYHENISLQDGNSKT